MRPSGAAVAPLRPRFLVQRHWAWPRASLPAFFRAQQRRWARAAGRGAARDPPWAAQKGRKTRPIWVKIHSDFGRNQRKTPGCCLQGAARAVCIGLAVGYAPLRKRETTWFSSDFEMMPLFEIMHCCKTPLRGRRLGLDSLNPTPRRAGIPTQVTR